MRQHLIFTYQGGSRNLRHHEAGIQASTRGKKWRKAFIESRIDESLDATLGNSGKRAESDGHEIERECDGLAVKVAAGKDDGLLRACGNGHPRSFCGA